MNLKTPVWQLMSHPVIELADDMGIREAAEELQSNGISGAPVIDVRGEVIGVLSLRDLAACVAARLLNLPALFPSLEASETPDLPASCPAVENIESARVSDMMSPTVLCVDPESSILEAVRLMREHAIHRVFVRRGNGPLKGVITTSDVLRWVDEDRAGRRKSRKSRKTG